MVAFVAAILLLPGEIKQKIGVFAYKLHRLPHELVARVRRGPHSDEEKELYCYWLSERFPSANYNAAGFGFRVEAHYIRFTLGQHSILLRESVRLPWKLGRRIGYFALGIAIADQNRNREVDRAIIETERETALMEDAQSEHEMEREEDVRRQIDINEERKREAENERQYSDDGASFDGDSEEAGYYGASAFDQPAMDLGGRVFFGFPI